MILMNFSIMRSYNFKNIVRIIPIWNDQKFFKSYLLFRDWRKSGLTEYVCPGEVDPDIDDHK